ncbi:MAG: hypothetical protein COA78_00670 [Blastopirellula sp.]|nr:MAG: hypothetical protein COA78_00670 [Blastopirellula sp.]
MQVTEHLQKPADADWTTVTRHKFTDALVADRGNSHFSAPFQSAERMASVIAEQETQALQGLDQKAKRRVEGIFCKVVWLERQFFESVWADFPVFK